MVNKKHPKNWIAPLVALRTCSWSISGHHLKYHNISLKGHVWLRAVAQRYTPCQFALSRRLMAVLFSNEEARQVAIQHLLRLARDSRVSQDDMDDADSSESLWIAQQVLLLMEQGGLLASSSSSSSSVASQQLQQEQQQRVVQHHDKQCVTCYWQDGEDCDKRVNGWARMPCHHDVCVMCDVEMRAHARKTNTEPLCPLCRQPRFVLLS